MSPCLPCAATDALCEGFMRYEAYASVISAQRSPSTMRSVFPISTVYASLSRVHDVKIKRKAGSAIKMHAVRRFFVFTIQPFYKKSTRGKIKCSVAAKMQKIPIYLRPVTKSFSKNGGSEKDTEADAL